jgi:transposase
MGRERRSTTGSGVGHAPAPLSALVAKVQVPAEAIDDLDREVSADSSIVRAHQHAAGARRTTAPPRGEAHSSGGHSEPGDHAIGRSRGGLTTKIHLACDGHGRPLSVVLTGGNVNDCTQFTHVMAGVEFRRPGPGRPARRPSRVWAGQGLLEPSHPFLPASTRIPATIPERRDQRANRAVPWSSWWSPTGFRPCRLPAPQHRRTLLQPSQAVPCHRHPLRQDRHLLPRVDRPGHPPPLALRTGPSPPG